MSSRDARMSAREEKSERAGSCSKGYCIEQTLKVTGTLQDLPFLEVDLSTLNGGVKVTAGAEGQWSMVAKLTSKASSREAAEAAMRDLGFVWSHEDGGSHLLDAKATFEGRHNGVDRGADISVVMPRSLVLRLVAETTNGGVDVKGVRTDGLSAGTTNGRVRLRRPRAPVAAPAQDARWERWHAAGLPLSRPLRHPPHDGHDACPGRGGKPNAGGSQATSLRGPFPAVFASPRSFAPPPEALEGPSSRLSAAAPAAPSSRSAPSPSG